MQGSSHLHKLQDKLPIVPGKSQKLQTLVTLVGVGKSLMAFILLSLVAIPWAEMICPE